MNSSAKKTAFSLLASMALGAAAWMGCTVTSGTIDDVDGGTGNTNIDSGTGTNEDGGTTTPQDGGTVGTTCKTKQESIFVSETCQACVENNCCEALKGCFDNLSGDPDAGTLGCNEYNECIDACSAKPDNEVQGCYDDCDTLAAPGIAAAYSGIETCAQTTCATECGASAPDGG